KIEHVALIVQNIDESVKYYENLFGFQLRVKGKNPRREMAFLYHPAMTGIEIELIQDLVPLGEYHCQGVVNHLAFTVENMEKAIANYREKGVVFLSEAANAAIDGAKTIFFYGPNNELLQLVEPAPRT
nr:VOC family protein [Desulfitobacterium hafniense]